MGTIRAAAEFWAARALLIVVVAAALGSCQSTTAPGGSEPAPDDVATYAPAGPGGDAADLEAVLQRERGCVTLREPSGLVWLPVFPQGARWEGDVLVVRSARWTVGEVGRFGGGELNSFADHFVPDVCDTSLPGWLVYAGEA